MDSILLPFSKFHLKPAYSQVVSNILFLPVTRSKGLFFENVELHSEPFKEANKTVSLLDSRLSLSHAAFLIHC